MKIFLIRHGESIQNTKEYYKIGLPDHKVYLSKKREQRAIKTGKFLKKYVDENKIDLNKSVLWISPYERTRQTARLINDSLNIQK